MARDDEPAAAVPKSHRRRWCGRSTTPPRDLAAFFLLGLMNNSGYNVSLASANEISNGAVGEVFLAAILPALLIKASAPYWFRHVSYPARALTAAALMTAAFLLVAVAPTHAGRLVGVGLVAAQSGLGEASTLALAGAYPGHRALLTAWSSGTGFSGIFGYTYIIVLHTLGGLSLRATLLTALTFPAAWLVAHFLVLRPPPTPDQAAAAAAARPLVLASGGGDAEAGDVALAPIVVDVRRSAAASATSTPTAAMLGVAGAGGRAFERAGASSTSPSTMTAAGRTHGELPVGLAATFRHVMSLWRYTVPLLVVFYAEYVCQAGVWAAVGFPDPADKHARNAFYKAANWCYQAGVFVSRSSGTLLRVPLAGLWAMPTIQVVLLTFFAGVAAVGPPSPLYGWWLLAPALIVGLMGGVTYVNAFTLLAAASPPATRELSLGAASVADSIGIALADASSVLVQGCLFRRHGVEGAAFGCGAR